MVDTWHDRRGPFLQYFIFCDSFIFPKTESMLTFDLYIFENVELKNESILILV
jgi:hypothetical protein